MNFDYFNYLHDGQNENPRLAFCLELCKKAEMYARIDPGISAVLARCALEKLFTHLSKINGLHPENLSESITLNCQKFAGNADKIADNCNEIADMCSEITGKREDILSSAHMIRRHGNDAAHPKIRYVDAATEENVKQAIMVCRMLFDLLCYFEGKGKDFDPEIVPFFDLAIDHKIRDADNPNKKAYIVYRDGTMRQYYYLQCLSLREAVELENRRIEANKRIYDRKSNRNSRILLPDTEQFLPVESEQKILLYRIFNDSIILSELQKPLSPQDALQVCIKLCDGLAELESQGMSHRNLYPGNILLEETDGDEHEAYLLNLRTSKIRSSDVTVNHKLAAAWDSTCYIPKYLQGLDELPPDTPWDKLDVYALCRVVLFCMGRELALVENTAILREYAQSRNIRFSNDFMRLYKLVFMPDLDLDDLPEISQLKRIFEDAICRD